MPDKVTADGYEQQMQTNHLSHFLLTSRLMPALEAAAAARGEARVVNHTSGVRKVGDKALQRKYLEKGLEALSGAFGGDGSAARVERYQQSKLANAIFTAALQVRMPAAGYWSLACRRPCLTSICRQRRYWGAPEEPFAHWTAGLPCSPCNEGV